MSEKTVNSKDFCALDFLFCCDDMASAQLDDYLLVDYDPETKLYFFRMIYPFHKSPYFFYFCPFCATDLRKFPVILKEE